MLNYFLGARTLVGSGLLVWGSNPEGGKGICFFISIHARPNTHSAPSTMGNGVRYQGWSGQGMAWPPTTPDLALRLYSYMSRAIFLQAHCASHGMLWGGFYLDLLHLNSIPRSYTFQTSSSVRHIIQELYHQITVLAFKFLLLIKNMLFEQKKVKLWQAWHSAENKAEIRQNTYLKTAINLPVVQIYKIKF
jgi:hypothetical protein